MERREFLLALPLLIAARPFPGAERTLGIAYGNGSAGTDAKQGVAFGLAEARRTAQLPGRELTWREQEGGNAVATLGRAGAELIIAIGDAGQTMPGTPPVLRVPASEEDRSSCGGEEWLVGPAAEQRAAAIATYRARNPRFVRGLRALAWTPALEKHGAQQLNERYHAFAGTAMSEGAWLGWIATRVALECALRGAPARTLRGPAFAIDGHKGAALRFEPYSRRLQQPLYITAAGRAAPLAEITPEPVQAICTSS